MYANYISRYRIEASTQSIYIENVMYIFLVAFSMCATGGLNVDGLKYLADINRIFVKRNYGFCFPDPEIFIRNEFKEDVSVI